MNEPDLERVEVVPWTPRWAEQFEAARAELQPVFPAAVIEHIGSTSVRDLPAKPIIDLMIVTERLADLKRDPSGVVALGYEPRPDFFAGDPDHLCFVRRTGGRRTEHLHVFHPRSPVPQQDREFRDYLRAQPTARRRYAATKRRSAAAHRESHRDYGEAKRMIVEAITAEARAWAESGPAEPSYKVRSDC